MDSESYNKRTMAWQTDRVMRGRGRMGLVHLIHVFLSGKNKDLSWCFLIHVEMVVAIWKFCGRLT